MSKLESISRYKIIINRLRNRPATFEEISDYLQKESELQERNFELSKRTFQRDVKEIRAIFNIDIKYNRTAKKYQLTESANIEFGTRILEAYDVFNALNVSERVSEYIQFEKRKPQGTENLEILIDAIKKRKKLNFTHQKFWDENSKQRFVSPYFLKEFKSRWYLVAKDENDKNNTIKTFGLDRLTNPTLSHQTFEYPTKEVLDNKFKNCFGVITPDKKITQKIVLSFTTFQAKYIKTLPLHETQEIISENTEECVFSINIHPTDDFIFELISYGDSVKVLEPKSLIETIKRKHQKALAQYE